MTTVKDADQSALDITELMGRAMSGPAQPRTVPSPSDIDPDAPHGRGDDGEPLAPYGWTKPQTKDDKPRPKLTAGGRKSKDDSRVATVTSITRPASSASSAKAADKQPDLGKPKLEPRDYTEGLAATSEALWVGLSVASVLPLDKTPIIGALPIGKGRKLGDVLKGINDRIAAQAHIFNANRGALVAAVNVAAQNSQRARNLAEKLESGDATWCLMVGAMVMPFVNQSASLWTDSLAADGLPGVEQLAKANQATLDGWIAKFNAQLAEQTAEATAEADAVIGGDPA